MLRSILSICITAFCGLLVCALLLPTQANDIAQSVLGGAIQLNNASVVTVGEKTFMTPVSTVTSTVSKVISSIVTKTAPEKETSPLSTSNIIDATNNERIALGLAPLKTNEKLNASAKIKVDDMIQNQYFEHMSPSGKNVSNLGDEVGYDFVVMGENLALGDFSTAQDLLSAWMNSPGHRANIVNTNYQDIGVYAAKGSYQGREVWFAVQHFGAQRGVCPAISATLKKSIDQMSVSIKAQEAEINKVRDQIEDPNHPTGQEYRDLVAKFNALVSRYNADLALSQAKIADYNKQVVAFNKCLGGYQAGKE